MKIAFPRFVVFCMIQFLAGVAVGEFAPTLNPDWVYGLVGATTFWATFSAIMFFWLFIEGRLVEPVE